MKFTLHFQNYSKRSVMELALPVAVKFLHKGNKELSRNLSSYLSLAAISNADLLANHVQPIIDSFIAGKHQYHNKIQTFTHVLLSFLGNYTLARVLPQIHAENQEAIHGHVMALASLLPLCDTSEKIYLLSLLSPIARNHPSLLEASLPQLCDCLSVASAIPATLQLLFEMASYKSSLLVDYAPRVKEAVESSPLVLCLAAQVMARIGHVNLERGLDALNFIVDQIMRAENHNIPSLLREISALCTTHPSLLNQKLLNQLESLVEGAPSVAKTIYQQMKNNLSSQRSGFKPSVNADNITVLKVNADNQPGSTNHHRLSLPLQGFTGNFSTASNGPSNRASVGGFVNLTASNAPSTTVNSIYSTSGQFGNQGIPNPLVSYGPGVPLAGMNSSNANTVIVNSSNRVVNRTKQADASRSTPRLTPPTVPGSNAAAMNRSMSWINAVHMSSANRLSPSPAAPMLNRSNIPRFGSSHQMAIGSNPYGPSREAHGPGIHNPNQGGRSSVFASRGSRGSLSTNRVQVVGGPAPMITNPAVSSGASNPMRSVSGSLTTMKEDPETDLRINMFGHQNLGIGMREGIAGGNAASPSPVTALSNIGRLQNPTPISMIPSSLSSLAPSPPPLGQHSSSVGVKLLDDIVLPIPGSIPSHKVSINTLASQSTLSFHNSNVTLGNPAGEQQQQVIMRRSQNINAGYSGNPNGERDVSDGAMGLVASQRISVFEPYPMQDAVKHFCDKHLDKIKAYMERLTARLPLVRIR